MRGGARGELTLPPILPAVIFIASSNLKTLISKRWIRGQSAIPRYQLLIKRNISVDHLRLTCVHIAKEMGKSLAKSFFHIALKDHYCYNPFFKSSLYTQRSRRLISCLKLSLGSRRNWISFPRLLNCVHMRIDLGVIIWVVGHGSSFSEDDIYVQTVTSSILDILDRCASCRPLRNFVSLFL